MSARFLLSQVTDGLLLLSVRNYSISSSQNVIGRPKRFHMSYYRFPSNVRLDKVSYWIVGRSRATIAIYFWEIVMGILRRRACQRIGAISRD
jgi:hypothetical protein